MSAVCHEGLEYPAEQLDGANVDEVMPGVEFVVPALRRRCPRQLASTPENLSLPSAAWHRASVLGNGSPVVVLMKSVSKSGLAQVEFHAISGMYPFAFPWLAALVKFQ